MESWIQTSKGILLLYLVFVYAFSDSNKLPWLIVFVLFYLCINLAIYLVQKKWMQNSLNLLSIIAILFSAFSLQPLIILLLPINIFELGHALFKHDSISVLVAFLPILVMEKERSLIYGLVTAFSFLVFLCAKRYAHHTTNLESETDQMRKKIQKLSTTILDLQNYIQQSEYMNRLDERNRLTQEIHDKLGHFMTGAFLQMQATKRLIHTDKKQALHALENAIQISKEGFAQIRNILKNTKPQLQQLGIHRIRFMLEEFRTHHGIKTHFYHHGNIEVITPLQWKVIDENMTEALTNIMKHAEATEVSLTITVLNKLIKVEIKDNGKGVDAMKKGIGIMGMEERISTVDGQVIVDGSNGFSVTMLMPISHESFHEQT